MQLAMPRMHDAMDLIAYCIVGFQQGKMLIFVILNVPLNMYLTLPISQWESANKLNNIRNYKDIDTVHYLTEINKMPCFILAFFSYLF
ncbi:hypothetical protein GDO86_001251 [Hymenochirus boettgeri]|uniref:Uncharacterized protein n=1 Tax=Hymenochirus boettgeri TaxID=247094 RepID=A0A8T2KCV6_9PIPI|nr:hypothetical protein GDO86_001251 [Hymenochirus boettgeri]